jgi:hypothetical protein
MRPAWPLSLTSTRPYFCLILTSEAESQFFNSEAPAKILLREAYSGKHELVFSWLNPRTNILYKLISSTIPVNTLNIVNG